MTTAGVIMMLVGIFGSVWAKLTSLDFNDFADYAFTGGSAFKINAYRFFNGYGMVLILLGFGLTLFGMYRKNKNDTVHIGGLNNENGCSRSNQSGYVNPDNTDIDENVKLVLDKETREIKWVCSNCGKVNSCDDLFCSNCQQKR